MNLTNSSSVSDRTGQDVLMAGFVHSRRDHGRIIFIDLRDRQGLTQVVFKPDIKECYKMADKLSSEDVIQISGKVSKRPKGMENSKILSGSVEVEAAKLEILSESETLPFEVDKDTKAVSEDKRLKYRYLDIRSQRLKNNIILRHKVVKFIRGFLDEKGFIEIETPILTKSTPEGARDYLVPSRQQPGKFYALPQSPQQYKQLLMVAGIEKYFQIARCFRDEDPRGDRQPEFTQLDLEMSFVSQNDILNLAEELFIKLVKTLLPHKKITKTPFPRLNFRDVMEKYKTDRPDLRRNKKDKDELSFAWILGWPLFSYDKKEKRYDPNHHIFTAPQKADIKYLDSDPLKVHSWQHDLVLNGQEIGGGSIRITDPEIQKKIFKLVGISEKEAEQKFGHLLEAFKYGVPPHGGIAPGIDRIASILAGEENIREVIAFPKTGDGRDLMMNSPSDVTKEQLEELKIKLTK